MKRTALFFLLMCLPAAAQTFGNMTMWMAQPSAPVGTTMTTTILGQYSLPLTGCPTGSWSITGTAPKVGTSQGSLGASITAGGVTYPSATPTNSIAFDDGSNFSYVVCSQVPGGSTMTIAGYYTPGFPTGLFSVADVVRMDTSTPNAFVIMQLQVQGSTYCIRSHAGSSADTGPCVSITPGQRIFFNLTAQSGVGTTVRLYNATTFASIGSSFLASSGTAAIGTPFRWYLGNVEAMTSAGHTDFFEDVMTTSATSVLPSAPSVVPFDPTANNFTGCTANANPAYCNKPFTALSTNPANTNAQTQIVVPAPGNVSTLAVCTYLYSGACAPTVGRPRYAMHWQPWLCNTGTTCNSHINVGYNENNSATVTAQLAKMVAVGVDVVVPDYYGNDASKSFNLASVDALAAVIAAAPASNPKLLLNLDQGAWDIAGLCLTDAHGGSVTTVQMEACIENQLDYAAVHYFYKSYYETTGGKPIVTLFLDESSWAGVTWATVYTHMHAHVAAGQSCGAGCTYTTQLLLLSRNSVAITQSGLDGGFAWPPTQTYNNASPATQLQYDGTAGYFENFYSVCQANPTKVCMGLIYKGFDDSNASFGTGKVIAQQEAQVLGLSAGKIASSGYSSTLQIPYVQVDGWNDYEEGTAVETGVDPGFAIAGIVAGTFNYTLSKNDPTYSSLSTFDHFQLLYCSTPTNCLVVPGQSSITPALSGSVSLANVPAGVWQIELQAIGKPLVRNVVSSTVAFNVGSPPWAGVVANSRAIDWSQTGVTGGIPDLTTWTQSGATIAAYTGTPATINNAIAACGSHQYVQLGAGTFTLSDGIVFNNKSFCVLRGLGANQTIIKIVNGTTTCGTGAPCGIIMRGADNNSSLAPTNTATWSAGYAQGTKAITLSSKTNLIVGNFAVLDQTDDDAVGCDIGGVLVADITTTCTVGTPTAPGINGPYSGQGNGGGARTNRAQQQIVQITSISGTGPFTIGISPGLYMPNWSATKTPQAWWATSPSQFDGVENLQLDSTQNGNNASQCSAGVGVGFYNADNSWLKGVAGIDTGRAQVQINWSAHVSVVNNYFWGTQNHTTCSYGVELFSASDQQVENNIFQVVTSPYMSNGPDVGTVFDFNFSVNNLYTPGPLFSANAHGDHDAGNGLALIEGNIGNIVNADVIHGTGNLNSYFRNYYYGQGTCYSSATDNSTTRQIILTGTFALCTQNTSPFVVNSFHRFYNLIANIAGTTAWNTGYTSGTRPVFDLGGGNAGFTPAVPNDPNVAPTTMLWGNAVSAHSFTPDFNCSEVPSGLTGVQANFANPCPTSTVLPPSFYYSSKPSWWPTTKPWPAIGPDVTGGNVSGVSGHVFTNPAQDCYIAMGGPANGVGLPLSFNAASCYTASGPTGPVLGVSPTSNNFGSIAIGNSGTSFNTTLTNTGGSALTISSVTLTGADTSQFALANSCGTTINAGASCQVRADFTPTTAGSKSASITIASNANNGTQVVALSGIGAQPAVSLSPISIAFGSQAVGAAGLPTNITVTNNGTAALNFTSVVLGGANAGDFILGNSCSASLAAGANCNISVRFSPTASGNRAASVVLNDDAANSPQSVSLSGLAIQPVASFSPSLLIFGSQTIATVSSPQNIVLTNTGTSALLISSIVASGDFSFTHNCPISPASVAINGSCTIQITFTPSVAGSRSGLVTVASNGLGSPQPLSLTGTGQASTNCGVIMSTPGVTVSSGGVALSCPLSSNGAPSAYAARADTCFLPTDTWNGQSCGSLGLAMNFLGRPGDPVPNLGGPTGANTPGSFGGTTALDVDFGTKMLRVTDFNDDAQISLASGGNNNFFEIKSNAIFFTNAGGNIHLKRFNPATFQVKNSQIQSQNGAGDSTHISGGTQGNHGVSWSAISNYTFFEMYESAGSSIIDRVIYNPATDTLSRPDTGGFPFQLVGVGNCLPGGYAAGWVGTFNTSADDSTAGLALSTHNSQGTGNDIVAYRTISLSDHPGIGCRYLNTSTYAIVGDYGCSYIEGNLAAGCTGPANADAMTDDPGICGVLALPCKLVTAGVGPVLIHDANQTNNPNFLFYSGPGDGDDGAGTTWETPTNMVRSCWLLPGCAGHGAKGSQSVFRGGKVLKVRYDHPIVSGMLNPGTQNFCLPRLPTDPTVGFPDDAHGTYNNADANDSTPAFFANTAVPGVLTGYPAIYYNEEVAVIPNGTCTPPYRFAHNYNTGSEPVFAQQNAIGIVSQDGKFFMFLSDMMGTMGNYTGGSTCNGLVASNIWMGSTSYPVNTQLISKSTGSIWQALNTGISQAGNNSPLDNGRLPQAVAISESGTTATATWSTKPTGWKDAEVVSLYFTGASVAGYNNLAFDNATITIDTITPAYHATFTAPAGLGSATGATLFNLQHDTGSPAINWLNVGQRDCRADVIMLQLKTL